MSIHGICFRIYVIYLITLSVADTLYRRILGWIMRLKKQKAVILAWFEVLALRDWGKPRHSSGCPRFETGTFHIYRSITHSTSMLGLTEINVIKSTKWMKAPSLQFVFCFYVLSRSWGEGLVAFQAHLDVLLLCSRCWALFCFPLKVVMQ
jgi:hypothetical protein